MGGTSPSSCTSPARARGRAHLPHHPGSGRRGAAGLRDRRGRGAVRAPAAAVDRRRRGGPAGLDAPEGRAVPVDPRVGVVDTAQDTRLAARQVGPGGTCRRWGTFVLVSTDLAGSRRRGGRGPARG